MPLRRLTHSQVRDNGRNHPYSLNFDKSNSASNIKAKSKDTKIEADSPLLVFGRRAAISRATMTAGITIGGLTANAPKSIAEPTVRPMDWDETLIEETGLLESRVTENLMSPPTYGLENSDIFYPSYFAGVWNVTSEMTDVYAPCGLALFGGNTTFENAKLEIGPEKALKYRARFLRDEKLQTLKTSTSTITSSESIAIADREFNVREIAKSAMGTNSVVDISLVTPNKFSCLLAPKGAGKTFTVDMIALARRQEQISKAEFDCSEVVRQIIYPVQTQSRGTQGIGVPNTGSGLGPNLKEIETISLYTIGSKSESGYVDEIKCLQRSASYLLPSQTDPLAYRMWQAARGRPIDVRFYKVTYSKKQV